MHDDETDEDELGAFTPTRVPCSYPGCTRLTYVDAIYGDLCHQHIRAENE